MATVSPPRRTAAPPRKTAAAARTRARRLADARASEVRARRELGLAFARMELTHAQAARDLEAFETYFASARKDLQRALRRYAR